MKILCGIGALARTAALCFLAGLVLGLYLGVGGARENVTQSVTALSGRDSSSAFPMPFFGKEVSEWRPTGTSP